MAEHEANELRQLIEQDLRELALLLAGIGDAVAGQRPQPGGWSVKELLALLSERIRVRFTGLGDVLHDPAQVPALPVAADVPEKLRAIVTTCGTVAALVARCRGDFEDLANLVAEAPSDRLWTVAAQSTGSGVIEVEVLVWVQAVCNDDFQEQLAQIRTVRDGLKG